MSTEAPAQKAYRLECDRFEHKAGTTVYEQKFHDYGLANDDSRLTGVEHVSVTLKSDGGYPGFTVPRHQLKPVAVSAPGAEHFDTKSQTTAADPVRYAPGPAGAWPFPKSRA